MGKDGFLGLANCCPSSLLMRTLIHEGMQSNKLHDAEPSEDADQASLQARMDELEAAEEAAESTVKGVEALPDVAVRSSAALSPQSKEQRKPGFASSLHSTTTE